MAVIPLYDPDLSDAELKSIHGVLASPALSRGSLASQFERAFAEKCGRAHAVSFATSGIACYALLKALNIGAGDEIIASPLAWHQIAKAVPLSGAFLRLADINYWTGTLNPAKVEEKISANTKAILAGNALGHPAEWQALQKIAQKNRLYLLEDSTEAIASRYLGKPVGSFGIASVFDFAAPSPLATGEGAMVLTDDKALHEELRVLRGMTEDESRSVIYAGKPSLQAYMSELSAALGLAQLQRLDEILEKRLEVESWYFEAMKSFEGIKDPYCAPEVDFLCRTLYGVHLGTRFSKDVRRQIIQDLRQAGIDAMAYPLMLQRQRLFFEEGVPQGPLPKAEQIGERLIVLPLHGNLDQEDVAFIAQSLKDAAVNVGAGAAIY